MKREIKSTLALDGEAAYKNALAAINREQRVLKSELSAVSSAFDGNANAVSSLTAKDEVLNRQIDSQKTKVSSLRQAVAEAAVKYGETDQKTDGYRIQLNNAQTALNKMESEQRACNAELVKAKGDAANAANATQNLGRETAITETKEKNLNSTTSKLGGGLKNFASGAAHVAVGAITAIATATGAAVAGAIVLGKQAMETADQTQKLADTTGYTAEQIQVMEYQGKALGVDIDTMTGAQSKMTKTMSTARDQIVKHNEALADAQKHHKKTVASLGPVATAYQQLGVKVVDSNGKLRDAKVIMGDALTALGKIKNETERDAMAQQLFGKSAMDLEPIIKAGGKGLQDLANQAYKTGAIMSNDAVAGLDDAGDSIDSLKTSAIGIAGTFLNTFSPQIKSVISLAQGLATSAATAAKTGDWSTFTQNAMNALHTLVSGATGMLPNFISVGTQIITTLVSSIVSAIPSVLPSLITGVLKLVNAVVSLLSTQGPTLIKTAVQAAGELVRGLLQSLPKLLDAAIQIVLALVNGISAQLPALIPAAVQCVIQLVQSLVNNIPMLIDAAITLILSLVDGLIAAIPMLVKAMPQLVVGIVNGIVNAIPKLLDAALAIIMALINFLPTYVPMLIKAVPQIMVAIVTGLIQAVTHIYEFIPVLWGALYGVLVSVWNSAKDWCTTEVPKIITTVEDFMKGLPGKILAAIGTGESNMGKWRDSVKTWVAREIPKLIAAAVKFFTDLPDKIAYAIGFVIGKLTSWNNSVSSWITSNVSKLISNIVTYFTGLPVKVYNEIMGVIGKLTTWANNVISSVKTEVPRIISNIVSFFSGLPGKIATEITNTVAKVKEFADKVVNWVKGGGLTSAIENIRSTFAVLPGKVLSIGTDIVTGLWNGVKNMGSWLIGKIKGFAADVISGFKNGFDSHSPSKKTEAEGKNLVLGLKQGILAYKSTLTSTLSDIAKNMMTTLADGIKTNSKKAKAAMTAAVKDASDEAKKLQKAAEDLEKSHAANLAALQKTSAANVAEIKKNYKEAVADINSQKSQRASDIAGYGGLFDAGQTSDPAEVTADSLLANMQKSEAGVKQFQASMAALTAKNLPKAMMDQLQQLGPDSNTELAALNSMTAAQLDQYVKLWNDKQSVGASMANAQYADALSAAKASFDKSIADENTRYKTEVDKENAAYLKSSAALITTAQKETTKLGTSLAAGLIKGMKGQKSTIISNVNSIMADMIAAMKKSLGIKSPSVITEKQIGLQLMAGISRGMNKNSGMINDAMDSLRQKLTLGAVNMTGSLALAGASAGGSAPVSNNPVFNISMPGNYTIRSDQDITAISKGIANEAKNLLRAGGVKS